MSESLDVEFHFSYDKVRVECMPEDDFGRAQAEFYDGRVFEVKIRDFQGNPTGAVEVINPAMVTHMRVQTHRPF